MKTGIEKSPKLAEFLRREYRSLVRYVNRWVDRMAELDAEDIVQEVMVNLFERADLTIPVENLAAYIYSSLKNKVIDAYRRRKKVLSLDDNGSTRDSRSLAEVIAAVGGDAQVETEKSELMHQLFLAIESLGERDRAVVIATEMDGRSFRQLAEEWNEPVGTLLARKSRALKKIKTMLSDGKVKE